MFDISSSLLNNLIKFTIKLDTGVYDKELEYLFTSIMRSFLCESSDEEIVREIEPYDVVNVNKELMGIYKSLN